MVERVFAYALNGIHLMSFMNGRFVLVMNPVYRLIELIMMEIIVLKIVDGPTIMIKPITEQIIIILICLTERLP